MAPNNSFKPNLLRYTDNVAGKACHVVGYATQVGLTQALGPKPTSMQALIKKLGKPRSWLVFAAACFTSLLLGGLCVGLYFGGLQVAGRIGFWVVVVCWAVAGFSCFSYFTGQFSGRYRDLQGKGWAELPW